MLRNTVFLFLITFFIHIGLTAGNIDDLWRKYKSFDKLNRPKSAIEILNKIKELSIKENRKNDYIKAIINIAKQGINIEGIYGFKNSISLLKKEINNSNRDEIKAILYLVLADIYRAYYEANSYKLNKRSTVRGNEENDIDLWGAREFIKHISLCYDRAIIFIERVKDVKQEDFFGFIKKPNLRIEWEPYLYELVLRKTIEFYSKKDLFVSQPEDSFKPYKELFSSIGEFCKLNITGDDRIAKVILLYKSLLEFELDKKNINGLILKNIERLSFIHSLKSDPEWDHNYEIALKSIINAYRDYPAIAYPMVKYASFLVSKREYRKAYNILKEVIRDFSHTPFVKTANSIIANTIKRKELTISCKRIILPNKKNSLFIKYRNIDRVFFRLYPFDWEKAMSKSYGSPFYLDNDHVLDILSKKPIMEWDYQLPLSGDFKNASIEVDIPKISRGSYILIASYKGNFSKDKNNIKARILWVSNIGLSIRDNTGRVEVITVDATTGIPIDALVEVYKMDYKRDIYLKNKIVRCKDGIVNLGLKRSGSYIGIAKYNGDYIPFRLNRAYNSINYKKYKRVLLFTDRAIYRPGQTVHFSGILYSVDEEKKEYRIISNKSLDISLYDLNGKRISNISVITDEYGSFFSEFQLPDSGIKGIMRIKTEPIYGYVNIRVEEYKRPKFYVRLNKIRDAIRLNEVVKLSGIARSYTDFPVDNASIRYRVVRRVKFPIWLLWWRGGFSSEAKEITHGTCKTNKDGEFMIKFRALPDETIPKDANPVFYYDVSITCTDSAGESHYASTTIPVSYHGMGLDLNIPEYLTEDRDFNIEVIAKNIQGESLSIAGKLRILALKNSDKVYPKTYPDSKIYNWKTDRVMSEYSLLSDSGTAIKTINLKAGAYVAVADIRDSFGGIVTARRYFVVFDEVKPFNVNMPFFVQINKDNLEVGKKLKLFLATGYKKGPFLLEIMKEGHYLFNKWICFDKNSFLYELPIDETLRGGFNIYITMFKENEHYTYKKRIIVPWNNKHFRLKFKSFRRLLKPGKKEEWEIAITPSDNTTRMIATMYDASLDAIIKHSFNDFSNVFSYDPRTIIMTFPNRWDDFGVVFSSWNEYIKGFTIRYSDITRVVPSFSRGFRYFAMGMRKAITKGNLKIEEGLSSRLAKEQEISDSEMTNKLEVKKEIPYIRKNLHELAFFYPDLKPDSNGVFHIRFSMPEALTEWRFIAMAYNKYLRSGIIEARCITKKPFMIETKAPRFIRMGDVIYFPAKVMNSTDKDITITANLDILDMDGNILNKRFKNINNRIEVNLNANSSKGIFWRIKVPDYLYPVKFRVYAENEEFSDGEEVIVPVLSNKILVRASRPLYINRKGRKDFIFKELEYINSDSITPVNLYIQVVQNPYWYAVMALPYILESPYESSDSIFNRFYANTLGLYIIKKHPEIEEVFKQWLKGDTLKSPLERNEHLKDILLKDTPWVNEAKDETKQYKRISRYFNIEKMKRALRKNLNKLFENMNSNGSWPWFKGGKGNPYITLYIVKGFLKLRDLGIDFDINRLAKSIKYIDDFVYSIYEDIKKNNLLDKNNLTTFIAEYLYTRSRILNNFLMSDKTKEAYSYFKNQAKKYWMHLNRNAEGYIALFMHRIGEKGVASDIVKSLYEYSIFDEELGRYWSDVYQPGYWYSSVLRTQALMIQVFSEVAGDVKTANECRLWLLNRKRTTHWRSVMSTSEAIYALLISPDNPLDYEDISLEIRLGDYYIKGDNLEPGTLFFEKHIPVKRIKPDMSKITLIKKQDSVSWGGIYFSYLSNIKDVKGHATNLKIEKQVYVVRNDKSGEIISRVNEFTELSPGDRLKVRLILKTDRDMEFLHLRDYRPCGAEPHSRLSGYKYRDGLFYYESIGDSATDFFIEYLRKGTYVFEYETILQFKGEFETGIARIQCMYAPEFESHSKSYKVVVK